VLHVKEHVCMLSCKLHRLREASSAVGVSPRLIEKALLLMLLLLLLLLGPAHPASSNLYIAATLQDCKPFEHHQHHL
jgi:hypothetical protein